MKILALEHELPGADREDFATYAAEEAHQVWMLSQQDLIREIYFREDQDSAVLILECEDLAEAEGILASLPFVAQKLIEFELIPLKPYPGLGRLFE